MIVCDDANLEDAVLGHFGEDITIADRPVLL